MSCSVPNAAPAWRHCAIMKPPRTHLPVTEIESLIVTVREQRVILAPDLASVYGVPTKALNQAVKRNADKFPADFMFRLTLAEAEDIQRSRSQIVTLKRGQNIKCLPAGNWLPRPGRCRALPPQTKARPVTDCEGNTAQKGLRYICN